MLARRKSHLKFGAGNPCARHNKAVSVLGLTSTGFCINDGVFGGVLEMGSAIVTNSLRNPDYLQNAENVDVDQYEKCIV